MDDNSAGVDARVRLIVDESGRAWSVREKVIWSGSTRVLVFEHPEVIRVSRSFPPDWFTLSLSELLEVGSRFQGKEESPADVGR